MNNISFKGQYDFNFSRYPLNQEKAFQETLDENYFQLPKVVFKDGSTYQLRADKAQLECAQKLFNGDSVIFCAPTGTGKTADIHYAITKNLKENKKTIYTTPLKALANDKFREFRKIYGEEKVGLLTGDIKLNTNAPIQIMTTEIYNNQAGNLFDNPKNIGTVVFDEAHYLGDEDRGNVWENSILKTPLDKIKILCPSATIGNAQELTDWVQSLTEIGNVSKVELPPEERYVPLVTYLYKPNYTKHTVEKGEFLPVIDGKINLEELNPIDLQEKQKRALEILYKKEEGIVEYYEMTNEEYYSTAQELKNLLEDKTFSIEEFKNAKTFEEKEEELGDILFSLVNVARWEKIDPEVALSKANQKFMKRFNKLEEICPKKLEDLTFEEYDTLWKKAKELTSN